MIFWIFSFPPLHRALPNSEQPLLLKVCLGQCRLDLLSLSLFTPSWTPPQEATGSFIHPEDPNRVKTELCIEGSSGFSYKALF